jgi:hypothetical protein
MYVCSSIYVCVYMFTCTPCDNMHTHYPTLNNIAPHYTLYTTLQHTTLHYTTTHYTTPHYTTQHYPTQHYPTQHYTTPHYTTPNHTTPHYNTLHYTTLHHTTLYNTKPHYTTLPTEHSRCGYSIERSTRKGRDGRM